MKEKIECKGYWWLPNNEDNKVAGILVYTPGESIKLDLIGCLYPTKNAIDIVLENEKESVIYGMTSEGKKISLFNCFSSGYIVSSCPFSMTNYKCQYMIIGKYSSSLDEKCRYSIFTFADELNYWCHPSAINMKYNSPNDEINLSFSTSNNNVITEISINENLTLVLNRYVRYATSEFFLSPQLQQETVLKFVSKDTFSLREILKLTHLFKEFLSFATLRNIEYSYITLNEEIENIETTPYKDIRFFYIQDGLVSNNNKKNSYDFLFYYDDIKDEFPQIISQWFNDSTNTAPIRNHLIESIKEKRYFTSVDFLIVMQALEGFWWRYRDISYRAEENISSRTRTHLKTIINRLINEFSIIDKINNIPWDVREIVDSRDYFSHFVDKENKPNTKDGIELLELTKNIRILLICCVLFNSGFNYEKINEILNKCTNNRIE